ncbi:MAG TPA: tetratricopeptide repeat protein [Candidatus Rifleibacterium sp.]|nr:tetratricopeptide repeat protein [Candidatus Rifleibacterium sp.]HPT45864.1 tetratricopeptide repeat protein [Candidatus Rifleibacterium sp.]
MKNPGVAKNQEDRLNDLWFNVGYKTALGDDHESIVDLQQIIRLNPFDAAAYLYLGKIYLKMHECLSAEYYLACAAELDEDRFDVAFQFGTCLALNGHHRESLIWLQKAADLHPENPSAQFNLGMSHLVLGDEARAMELFALTIELNPDSLPAAFNLGLYFLKRGILERARHYFEKCTDIDPEFAPAWQNLLLVCLFGNEIDAAALLISKGLQFNPDNENLIVDSAAFANLHRKDEQLQPALKNSLQRRPRLVARVVERIREFKDIIGTVASTSDTIQ